MRKLLLLVCSIVGATVFAAPVVSGLKVTPIAPLGLALDYNVSGTTDGGKGCYLSVSMSVDGTNYLAKSLTGETNCVDGAHRVYWNMAKDGITLEKADISVEVKYTAGVGALYCVIDLSEESYPVTYCFAEADEPSEGFNTNEYKTAKLVLRRVDAGEFVMGDDQTAPDALANHKVTLTKPFYMGLFEVTQKQWELVMGSKPSSYFPGDTNPVECVSYDMIRGSSEGAKWPATNSVDATSFLGKLREKTGIDFDLPTEAQWEYTCRAGETTKYSYGNSADGEYMWYGVDYASGGTTHEVGTKKKNPWGFYDMHGNVWEWCLDRYDESSLPSGEDPKGSSSGSNRVRRGGGWYSSETYCTSSYRNYEPPSTSDSGIGFRLYRPLP